MAKEKEKGNVEINVTNDGRGIVSVDGYELPFITRFSIEQYALQGAKVTIEFYAKNVRLNVRKEQKDE